MTLPDYLRAAAARPWKWGEQDCCTFVAGWVIERGHSDPMAFIRGRYDSERSALLRISRGGGLVLLWQRGMGEAGIPEAVGLHAGDVGVIERETAEGPDEVAAIFSGERWVSLALHGIEAAPATALAAWRP